MLAIFNEAILNSTALYDYKLRTMGDMKAWFAAKENGGHPVIGGIDSSNEASVRLHKSLGITYCASIRQAGSKVGRWLDLEFYQLLLPGPAEPNED